MSLHSFRMAALTVEKLIKMVYTRVWLISCAMFYIYNYFTKINYKQKSFPISVNGCLKPFLMEP